MIEFHQISTTLERIDRVRRKDKKLEFINNLLIKCEERKEYLIILRMLLPHLDASRGSYSLKTINLAKLFIESYCYAPESSEYQMLIQYAREYHTADLSLTIHDLIRGSGQKSSIDIIEVDCLLQKLSESSLDSRRSDLKIHFRNVLSKMDALDHKWLTRLILKKIRIGCNESKILSCVSHDSIQVFNRTFSLQKVVERKFIELEEIEPSVLYGCAFRPMLCKRIFGEGQLQKLVNTDILWHCEMKYDGERIQLHKNQSHYSYFSRNGKEYSNVFGGSFNSGTLTRYIHSLFNEDIHSCILDGEMIGYSHNKQIYKTKSEQMEVKSFRNHSDYRPCFIAFDVLMVNDELFENKPLSERITRLNTIFTPRPGFLDDSIYSYFESAIMANFEGIVLKDPASQYFFNARCEHWLKLKPDYLKESITDIDVICVGAYSNKGGKTNLTPSSCHLGQILKAQTYYTKFLCAVQISAEETSKQSVDAVHLLKAICVVGLGLSIDTLDYINSLIHETEGLVVDQQSDTNKMVLNSIDFSQYSPDIYLDYRKSFILQIKAAEFSVKPESQKLVSFRFPRAQRLRLDKTYSDCTSLGEIEEMIESYGKTLKRKNSEYYLHSNVASFYKKSPKKNNSDERQASNLYVELSSEMIATKKILDGKEICLIDLDEDLEEQVALAVTQMGGTITSNLGHNTFLCVYSKCTFKLRTIANHTKLPIIHSDWIFESLESSLEVPMEKFKFIQKTAADNANRKSGEKQI